MPGKRRTISTPEPVQGRKHMDVQVCGLCARSAGWWRQQWWQQLHPPGSSWEQQHQMGRWHAASKTTMQSSQLQAHCSLRAAAAGFALPPLPPPLIDRRMCIWRS